MIKTFKGNEYNFYFLMGKFFADRKIIKEMDAQIYNDNDMKWYLDFNKEGQVIGFISIQKQKKNHYIDNFYVIPEYRNQGIGETLLKTLLDENKDKINLISRNEIAINLFKKYGFEEYGHNGRYKKMTRA